MACNEESSTEPELDINSLKLSGDISKTIDALTIAGLMVEDTLSIFTVFMQPKNSFDLQTEILSIAKMSDIIPPVGEYNIGAGANIGEEIISFFMVNDSTIYFMNSGSVTFTESKSTKVAGSFDMSGYLFDIPIDTTRILNIKGEFSTIPQDIN
jgi:hypothetical protein